MNENDFYKRFYSINKRIDELKEEAKELVWQEGIKVIINKIKRLNKTSLSLRDIVHGGWLSPEDLLFNSHDGYFAAKSLRIADDKLVVVYNTINNHEDSYESLCEYGEEDFISPVDETIAKNLLTQILPTILEDDVLKFKSDD